MVELKHRGRGKRYITILLLTIVAFGLSGCKTTHRTLVPVSTTATPAKKSDIRKFYEGRHDFLVGNYNSAYLTLLPIATQGNPRAQYAIGYMLYYGLGTIQNRRHAFYWTKLAAEQGMPEAEHAMSRFTSHDLARESAFNTTTPSTNINNAMNNPNPSFDTPAILTNDNIAKAVIPENKINNENQPKLASTHPLKLPLELKVQEKSLLTMDNNHYTLQIMASNDYAKLKQEIKRSQLTNTRTFHAMNKGADWYVLTFGDFASMKDANKAANTIHKANSHYHPWVRRIRSVKNEIAQWQPVPTMKQKV